MFLQMQFPRKVVAIEQDLLQQNSLKRLFNRAGVLNFTYALNIYKTIKIINVTTA